MADEPHIWPRHIRLAKLCMAGSRTWFKARGWDWQDFLENGIPAEALLETGDPIVLRVVEAAREEVLTRGR